MPEHGLVYEPETCPRYHRRLADRLQQGQAEQLIERSYSEGVCRNNRGDSSLWCANSGVKSGKDKHKIINGC